MNDRLDAFGDALQARLRPAGFRRRRNTWNRRSGALVDVVNLQISKSLTRAWVNLGVADPDIYEDCWGRSIRGRFVLEYDCTVRERLGILVDGHDRFWVLDDPAGTGDMLAVLESHGLPFLDRMHSNEAIEAHLEAIRGTYPPNKMALAVVRWRLGRRSEACKMLDGDWGGWGDRVSRIRQRLGCV
jgi:hypothetical protein